MRATLICAALIAASLGVSLTGCAGVSTDVRASPTATPMEGEHSYTLARSPLQDGNPDHTEYETLIRTELGKYGFADVAQQRAHYLLSIAYDTRLAGVGVGSADCAQQAGCGSPGEASFSLFGRRSYKHSLTLRFFEQTNGHEVYKVSVVSQDHDADPLHAIPYLVKSALAQFPFADHPDWRVKLRADATGGAPTVVSVKPVQP
ncbi:hypothetical protein P3T42_003470 [Paraburkholderia sp. GAS38]|uniref:DUF4136 domain-containing protein n=1 Tax=Paraburkholderia sp. GAS38 TaxID=3035133 RepID=UPI003D1DFEDF